MRYLNLTLIQLIIKDSKIFKLHEKIIPITNNMYILRLNTQV